MKPRATSLGADQEELLRLLFEHYAAFEPPQGVPSLSKNELARLVWGLLHDFVPAFRRPKHPGRKKQLLEWDHDQHTDPPDLKQVADLSALLKKHSSKRSMGDNVFKYVALNCREELPPIFSRRKTWQSLKQKYYEILARFDGAPSLRKMVQYDPEGKKLKKSRDKLAQRFRELGLRENQPSSRIATPTKPDRPGRQRVKNIK
jgi:hypothetical protein